jgi:hypothetical protein
MYKRFSRPRHNSLKQKVRTSTLFLLMVLSFLLSTGSVASAQGPRTNAASGSADEDHVRQTVTAFWKALGEIDRAGFKATLDWPNLIVESRPDKGTRAARANTDMAAFDTEMRRVIEQLPKGAKGGFDGTTITTFEVRFLNSSLAYAYHVCHLGGKGGDSEQARRGSRSFEAIGVLRKTSATPNPWRIILVTIPQ